MLTRRRMALTGTAGSLAAVALPGNSSAAPLPPLAGALQPISPPVAPPDTRFVGRDGSAHRLADFKGRGMVVNMWATWCGPCGAEMPSLQTLARALAPQDIAVLPLSSDRGGADAVQAWYDRHGIRALPVLLDPGGAMARALDAPGIPTSIVIDANGLLVARLEGAADWAAPDAQALVRRLTGA